MNGGVVWRRRVEWSVARRRDQTGAVVHVVIHFGCLIILKVLTDPFTLVWQINSELGTRHVTNSPAPNSKFRASTCAANPSRPLYAAITLRRSLPIRQCRCCTISGPYLRTIHLWEFDPCRRNLYFARHISTDGVLTSRIIGGGPFNAVHRGVPQAHPEAGGHLSIGSRAGVIRLRGWRGPISFAEACRPARKSAVFAVYRTALRCPFALQARHRYKAKIVVNETPCRAHVLFHSPAIPTGNFPRAAFFGQNSQIFAITKFVLAVCDALRGPHVHSRPQ